MFDAHPKQETPNDQDADIPPPDRTLQRFEYLRRYAKKGRIPWRKLSSWKKEDLCNESLVSPEDVGMRNGVPFPLRAHRFVSNQAFQESLKARFLDDITDASLDSLRKERPGYSAAGVLSLFQEFLAALLTLAFSWSFASAPMTTIIVLNAIVTLYFILAIAYRIILMIVGAKNLHTHQAKQAPATDELPVITILLPLYHDAKSLAPLSRAIDALEYPDEKMDVKLLLEADDAETIREARRLRLDERFDLIEVPAALPRTKPKACNYGMHLARGDLIVIYDAEDQPEHDQLLKAAQAFHGADPSLACIQARLNYYNANENWLTRLFTLEYSLWFDWLLPALQRLQAPIPLGGTSNFFKTDTLLEIGGWDPFNVTEDADLGIRLSRLGFRTEMLDSTTFEEANCRTGNWIRQRSRWMKGYLQTWLVHMRRPQDIIATTGWSGFLSVQLFLAGNVFSALISPLLWVVFAVWVSTGASVISAAFPGPLLWLNVFALIFGNLFFILLAVIAPLKRRWRHLSLFGVTAPFYWVLASIAAYKALWQIFFRPHYWEKTDHLISEIAIKRREDILRKAVIDKAG